MLTMKLFRALFQFMYPIRFYVLKQGHLRILCTQRTYVPNQIFITKEHKTLLLSSVLF